MDWHLLPEQLRALDQWVCADDKKQPRNAKTGDFAEVDDPTTWASFEEACKCAIGNAWDIGYVLSQDDEFTIVDLDNKEHNPAPEAMLKVHADILRGADTYIERSVSGTGYHVIIHGTAPRPIKTDWLEMYSTHRFMICTGDVVKDLPVADGMPLIEKIIQHFGAQSTYVDPMGELPDQAPNHDEQTDAEVLQRCRDAENGEKFIRLWQGELEDYNGDHSRADSALLNLLCFMTPHNEQVRRLFRASGLYRANQSNRRTSKYMNYSIMKWRGENPTIDLSEYSLDMMEAAVGQSFSQSQPEPVIEAATEVEAVASPIPKAPILTLVPSVPTPKVPKAPASGGSDFPPGIIGELARYALAVSYNPVPEGALVAALGYACGLVARGFHINNLGLNQYIVFIADSGVGKEGGKRAIRAVHSKVYEKVPAAQYCLGSADFSAGVSLVKELVINPCMLGVAGEIGITLKVMLDPRAPAHTKELKRALTDAWSESGPNGRLSSRKYSDRSKNSDDVKRPALSVIGESVPSHFYGALSTETANDGFITRWLVVEYSGERPDPNRKPDTTVPAHLSERLQDLFVCSKTNQDSNIMTPVRIEPIAEQAFYEFEDGIIQRVRALPPEHPVKAILNRTNEKALKLAGLLAACENPHDPVVTLEQAQWCMRFVTKADSHMISRFEDGSVGEGDETFEGHIRKAIRAYQAMTSEQRAQNKCPKCLLDSPAIPRMFFANYLKRRAAFSNHRFGAARAIEVGISECLDNGVLIKLPPDKKKELGMRGGDAYLLGDGW